MKGESKGSRWECVAEGVYRDNWSKKASLYERPVVDGHPTFRSLHTSNLEDAQTLLKARRTDQLRAEVGLADDPYKKANLTTVGEIIRQYQKDDYPDRLREARPERTRAIEAANCETLLEFFDALPVEDLRPSILDNYFDWRRNRVKKGTTGRRSTDMELNTLNNAMLWAHRRELIRFNPMPHNRPRYNSSRHVKHCRESCPADANVPHQFAKFLFQVPGRRSEALAWQMLIEAMTGLRTCEALQLRVTAKEGEPGYISDDWKVLHVGRAKGQVNVNPFVMVHPALKDALQALFKWKQERYPNSQWFFPSPRPAEGDAPVYGQALAHALRAASEEMKVKITGHGMRAFYVKVRRSWGIADNQIAAEIGHESGGRTLRDVYGSAPENWMLGEGPKMSWLLSNDKPAWEYVGTAAKACGRSGPRDKAQKTTEPQINGGSVAKCDSAADVEPKPTPALVVVGRKAKPQRQARRNAAPDQSSAQAGEAYIVA